MKKTRSPYFSVVIPALNEEVCLPHLLKNLADQSFKDLEVIVVDGRSKDHTVEEAEKFTTKLPLTILSSEKRNVSHQRNYGAAAATGKVLVFFDADTQIPKEYLKKIHHAFDTKKPHLLTTWIAADSKDQTAKLIAASTNIIFEASRFLGQPAAYGAMIAIRRKVFEDIGGFDEKTKFAEDSQIIQTAIDHHYHFLILPTPRYLFSLRRFRKEGTLETVQQYLRLNLATLTNGYHGRHPKYPMGGQAFLSTKSSAKSSLAWFDQSLEKLVNTTQTQQQKLEALVSGLFKDLF